MKKIYLMGLTAAFAMSVNAQTTIKLKSTNRGEIKNSGAAKGSPVASPMQITGGITCNTQYVAGTTMDLAFTLNLTNTDSEYGDMVTITFPTGITPNISANNSDPIGPDDGQSATGPEALNGVVGQTISWGDNDNNYGGITPGNNYNFIVNVTVDALATGTLVATYDISGDGYGSAPGDLIAGSMDIYPLGTPIINLTTNFVGVLTSPTTIADDYNCAMGTYTIVSQIKNVGTTVESNIPVNYMINGVSSTLAAYSGTLNPNDSALVAFPVVYDFSTSNIYVIKAWTEVAGDVSLANDTTTKTISNSVPVALTSADYTNGIESEYDFGSINKTWIGSGIPFGQSFGTFHSGTAALFYTIPGNAPAATYEALNIFPCVDVTSSEIYKISYWRKANTSGTLTVNGQSGIFTGTAFDAASMTTVVKAYSAITPNAQAGVWEKDSTYYTATANETRYFAIGGKGTITTTNDQINVRIDDVVITKAGTVGVKTIAANDAITMFPNPTSGMISVNAVEATSSIEVFNVIGEKVYSGNLVKGNNIIDLSDLSNGTYFVKMNSNNQAITKKVVLSK